MSDENIMLVITSGDSICCGISANSDKEMDDYTGDLLRYDIGTARREVADAKKLIREKLTFNGKKK